MNTILFQQILNGNPLLVTAAASAEIRNWIKAAAVQCTPPAPYGVRKHSVADCIVIFIIERTLLGESQEPEGFENKNKSVNREIKRACKRKQANSILISTYKLNGIPQIIDHKNYMMKLNT